MRRVGHDKFAAVAAAAGDMMESLCWLANDGMKARGCESVCSYGTLRDSGTVGTGRRLGAPGGDVDRRQDSCHRNFFLVWV